MSEHAAELLNRWLRLDGDGIQDNAGNAARHSHEAVTAGGSPNVDSPRRGRRF